MAVVHLPGFEVPRRWLSGSPAEPVWWVFGLFGR